MYKQQFMAVNTRRDIGVVNFIGHLIILLATLYIKLSRETMVSKRVGENTRHKKVIQFTQ